MERKVDLNEYGQIAHDEWVKSADIRSEIELDIFVVMPNHLHGIVFITTVGAHGRAPLHDHAPLYRPPRSLGSLIAGYKSAVTKKINQHRPMLGQPVWQRNYYEHIIRNEHALNAIREYITHNPLSWHLDRYNSAVVGNDPQAKYLWDLLKAS